MMVAPNYWTLEEALTLIRALQPSTRKFDYHLCLGGGVLNKGRSDKDLDLYFLPLNSHISPEVCKQRSEDLAKWLESLWGPREVLGGRESINMLATNAPAGSNIITLVDAEEYPEELPYRIKCKFNYSGLRVDVFIL